MNETYYLIDNNALLEIGRTRRETTFFSKHCRVTDDVAREAGPRAKSLPPPLKMTPRSLLHLVNIMSTLAPGDKDLVDLFRNKGAADPGLVATALSFRDEDEASLLPDTWVIVSRDKAVLRLAQHYELPCMKPDTLSDIIDSAHEGTTMGIDQPDLPSEGSGT